MQEYIPTNSIWRLLTSVIWFDIFFRFYHLIVNKLIKHNVRQFRTIFFLLLIRFDLLGQKDPMKIHRVQLRINQQNDLTIFKLMSIKYEIPINIWRMFRQVLLFLNRLLMWWKIMWTRYWNEMRIYVNFKIEPV